ncbi:ABC transporter substrate-binding protein [Clostridium sp. Mt-5]|uniref:ABC transporter substrate-binding protein n=1 Tax=Clostridium moutaii TaxID=3240932 RepID=A0ABV4BP97_9CLOT
MKKISIIVLSVIMVFALFTGCGSSSTSNSSGEDNSLQRVKDSGKLSIGLDDSYPPMEFRNDKNQLEGFDIDLGKELAKKLGVKYNPVVTDFNGIVLALQSGKFDVILATLSITDERKKSIDFIGPYINGGQIIIVKAGNTSIRTRNDLKNKIVGVQLGTTGEQAANKISGIKEIKKYDKITEAFHEVSIGRVDALICDSEVGEYYVAKDKTGYSVLKDKLTKEPVGMGIKKKDKKLQGALNKALEDLKKDGTLSKLSIKWFGHDIYKEEN